MRNFFIAALIALLFVTGFSLTELQRGNTKNRNTINSIGARLLNRSIDLEECRNKLKDAEDGYFTGMFKDHRAEE